MGTELDMQRVVAEVGDGNVHTARQCMHVEARGRPFARSGRAGRQRACVSTHSRRCFLSFMFLGVARRLELSPCNTVKANVVHGCYAGWCSAT